MNSAGECDILCPLPNEHRKGVFRKCDIKGNYKEDLMLNSVLGYFRISALCTISESQTNIKTTTKEGCCMDHDRSSADDGGDG